MAKLSIDFLSLLEAIELMKYDDRIKLFFIDFVGGTEKDLGFAQAQEVREAILELKQIKRQRLGQGQFAVLAHADTFTSQNLFYIASACDRISLAPMGEVSIPGFFDLKIVSSLCFFGTSMESSSLSERSIVLSKRS